MRNRMTRIVVAAVAWTAIGTVFALPALGEWRLEAVPTRVADAMVVLGLGDAAHPGV